MRYFLFIALLFAAASFCTAQQQDNSNNLSFREGKQCITLHHVHISSSIRFLKEGEKIKFTMKPQGRNAPANKKQNYYNGVYLGVDSGFVKIQITKVKSSWELKVDDKNAIVRVLPAQLDWIEVKRKKYYRQGSGNYSRYWTVKPKL